MSVFLATLPEWTIDASLQVCLGNEEEMKAFYVPELTSNALRVSEPDGDPSAVVSQLMKAATRAQTVCATGVTGRPILTCRPPPVLPIPVGMVSGTAANEVIHLLFAYLFPRD